MNLFFELLKVAVGNAASLPAAPNAGEWRQLFAVAKKQALVGVCFVGIEKLPAEQRPDRQLLMEWYGLTAQIEERNRTLNVRSVETCRYFEGKGFKACVLKGQGNAAMYPWPGRRQSGDIDVWIMPNDVECQKRKEKNEVAKNEANLKRSRMQVLRWARSRYPAEDFDMKHIHFPVIKDVEMEVHFVPSQLRNPLANLRLIRFYEKEAMTQMSHGVQIGDLVEGQGVLNSPTVEFNLVFQLTHIFNHFLSEGVGLRQVVDYYFLLVSRPSLIRGETEEDAVNVIQGIGLYGFAQALVWVLHEVLGMKEEMMLVSADEKRGRVLLDEILAGGNFGHYESRYRYNGMSRWKFYVARMRRMAHFLRYYPSEVLWDVPFRIRQRVWMAWAKRHI